MKHFWRLSAVGGLLFLGSALSCSGDHATPSSEVVQQANQELSATQIRVLGFEGVAGSGGDWGGANVKLQSGTQHIQGAKSAAFVVTSSAATLTSIPLSSLGPISNRVTLSVWLPAYLKGLAFQGQVGLHLSSSAAGLFGQYYGNVQFTQGSPTGTWQQIAFTLPAADVTALSTRTYSDLVATIDLTFNPNPKFDSRNPFADPGFVDALSFGTASSGVAGAGGTSGAAGSAGTGGSSGSAGSAGKGGGSGMGGASGTSGSGGRGGASGAAGASGSSGAGGASGGALGAGGTSGTSGTGGTAGVGGAAGAAGASNPCGFAVSSPSTPATPFTFAIKLPHGVPRESVGIATTGGSLTLDDAVQVVNQSGPFAGVQIIKDSGGFASVSSVAATSRTSLGVFAQVQDVYSEPPGVDLRNNAAVHGQLKTAADLSQQIGAHVDGAVFQNSSLQPLDVITWDVSLPTLNRGSCDLQPDLTQSAEPGSYGDVTVKSRSHLKLRSGTYFLSSLSVEPQAVLDLDNTAGPTFIYVKNGFAFGGTVVEADPSQLNFLFGVAGTTPIAIQSAFRGILVAPQTSVMLATNTVNGHVGSFFARSVEVQPATVIHQQPFSPAEFCASDAACSSFCPCPDGGSCTVDNQCRSGLTCASGTCTCTRSCGGKSCGQGDGCGGFCPNSCGDGQICTLSSECASGSTCTGHSSSTPGSPTVCEPAGTHCSNGVQDPDESDVDCGGPICAPCNQGKFCNTATDCASGVTCGRNNSACFGLARGRNICWPEPCGNAAEGGTAFGCGLSDSVCGKNCACVVECDSKDPNAVCPASEVCKPNAGRLLDGPTADACVDPRCPSNDPALCGTPSSLCGSRCVSTPNCAAATCEHPDDGCGGICPGVCHEGEPGCLDDVTCGPGLSCIAGSNGVNTCRDSKECAYKVLVPPLCGIPGAKCGEQCPVCTPVCDGRQCGLDLRCGQSCGTCGDGTSCNVEGQCVAPKEHPQPTVPNGTGGQTPLPELPKPETSLVGGLKGQFSVSEQGSAEFSVPIDVPPGRAGMEPALTLQYSGSRTNGDLGVGWHLEGLSKITRCPRNFALDGTTGPVRNDHSDLFCIDGKRLESVSGVYGADATQYRTLIDSFTKVVSYVDVGPGIQFDQFGLPAAPRTEQGPDFFRAWTKDGRILTYGRTVDSLVLASSGVRYAWLLNRVEDRAGNTMSVRYTNLPLSCPSSQTGAPALLVSPDAIAYTGHTGSPEIVGNREVHFEYEARNDPQLRYNQGGAPFVVQQRLSRVTTFVDKVPAKNYRLNYFAGDLSQIEKIFECAGGDDSHCKAPTVFEYIQEQGFHFDNINADLAAAGQLDINGDGLPDFLATNILVDGVPAQPTLKAAQVVSDTVVSGAALVADAYLGPAAGFAVSFAWDIIKAPFWGLFAKDPKITFQHTLEVATGQPGLSSFTHVPNVQGLRCEGNHPAFMLDYDQDGRDDVVSACGPNDSTIYVARSVGDGSFVAFPDANAVAAVNLGFENVFSNDGGTDTGTVTATPLAGPIFTDVDGDGLQDIVSCKDQYTLELRRRLPPPLSFETQPIQLKSPETLVETGDPDQPTKIFKPLLPLCGHVHPTYNIFDLDGDGTPDLLAFSDDGWKVLRFSVQSDTPLSWQSVAMPKVGPIAEGTSLNLADFNGDGLADVFSYDDARYTVWLNTGDSRFYSRVIDRPARPTAPDHVFNFRHIAVLDQNADGRDDLLEHWETDQFDGPLGGVSSDRFNRGLIPSSRVDSFASSEVTSIQWLNGEGLLIPGGFTLAGDVNGDGDTDLFGIQDAVFRGSGAKNTLLRRVTDGLGKGVDIAYGGYQTDARCGEGSSWPEKCLKRMNGVVKSYKEGVRAPGGDFLEPVSSFTYTFINGRMNLTGHGWLGFDRKIVETNTGRTTTVDYQPVARYRPTGEATTSVARPYLYPFAGLARTTTVDQRARTGDPVPPLQNGYYDRRTQVFNHWEVQLSAFNRPFPIISSRRSGTFERPVPVDDGGPPLPFENNGIDLMHCEEDLTTDDYGNVTDDNEECDKGQGGTFLEGFRTRKVIDPDPSTWLISNPTNIKIDNAQGTLVEREFDLTYVGGLLETVTRAPHGTADQRHKTSYVRDDFGNVKQIIESTPSWSPRTTGIAYDSDGIFPIALTNAAAQTTQLHFDPLWGDPETIVDPNGIAVRLEHDGFGRVVATHGPEGETISKYSNIASFQPFTAAGQIQPRFQVSVERRGTSGAVAGATVNEYDPFGRVVRTISENISGEPLIQESVYDILGRVVGRTLPHTPEPPQPGDPSLFVSTIPFDHYTFDEQQRIRRVDHSDGTFKEFQYASSVTLDGAFRHWIKDIDCEGNTADVCGVAITRTRDEEGHQNVVISDYAGKALRNVDAANLSTALHTSDYRYAAFNQLLSTQDNRENVTSFQYDDYGRLLTQTDPDSGTSTYEYSAFDELRTSTDPKLQLRTYQHDSLGRIESITDPAGLTQWIYDQGPNALGRVSESISPDGQEVHYSYEPVATGRNRGLLQSVNYTIDGSNYPVSFEYDDLGRTRRIHYPNRGTGQPIVAQYSYAPTGELTGLDEVGSGNATQLWRVNDVYQGHLIQHETFGNGAQTSYGYHAARHWLESIQTSLGGNQIQALNYTHYNHGLVHTLNATDASPREYLYDDLNRLSSVITTEPTGQLTTPYIYDEIGNLVFRGATSTSYLDSRPHLVDSVGENTYQYDANGNLSSRSGPDIPRGIQIIDYTPFDLPRSIISGIVDPSNDPDPDPGTVTFAYSADEERVARRDPDSARHFVADLYQRQLDGATNTTLEERFRLYAGSRPIAEIVRKNSSDQTLYFHTDHLGSPETISDNHGGTYRERFDPFGAPLNTPNPELTRVGFTGQDHENDLGLIDMKGRLYDPLAGRFTTPDPVMQAPFWSQGLNRYSYVFNDPVNNTDPSGFMANGGDSTAGIMGWGGGVVGLSAASAFGVGSAALGGLNIGTSFLGTQFDLFNGSAPSTQSVAPPSAAPKGGGGNLGAGAGAVGNSRGNAGPTFADVQKRADALEARLRSSDQRLASNDPWAAAGVATGALLADDATGIGTVDDIAIPIVLAGAIVYDATQRIFITYILNNPATGQVYIGRSSGFGTPSQILARRYAGHSVLRALGFTGRRVDVAAQGAGSYAAIRGREQQLMDSFGGVGDPKVANAIRGVSRYNPLGKFFHLESDASFGNIAPFTGAF